MAERAKKPETGVTRRVFFQGWCRRGMCDWKSPECQYKGDAAFHLAAHQMDRHGGQSTRGEFDPATREEPR